jgi:hypothetical protein
MGWLRNPNNMHEDYSQTTSRTYGKRVFLCKCTIFCREDLPAVVQLVLSWI